jgi:hypothetical protein
LASPSVTCYPTPGKGKAKALLGAFAQGAGGEVAEGAPATLAPGAAAFYGITREIRHLWDQVRREQRPYYYLDNSYFDSVRGKQFRVTRNALQAFERLPPDPARYAALGLSVQPWRKHGRHIVVCPQSDAFMRDMCSWTGGVLAWQEEVLQTLHQYTDRLVVMRHWQSDKVALGKTLGEDLKDAWALVTHSSAAAVTALLYGVPVFVTGLCAATPLASGELSHIEKPLYPDGRMDWAAGLAGAQWTEQELRNGTAWRRLNGEA